MADRQVRREVVLTVGSGLLAGAMLIAAFAPAPRSGDMSLISIDGPTLSPQAERGRVLVQAKGCVACHAVAGLRPTVPLGPDLSTLPMRAASRRAGMSAEEYVRESILAPRAFVIPEFDEQMPVLPITADELDALVAFLLGR
jgi:mono/diheme cytochrome c family protein